jgi:hypothetical protein
VSCLRLQVRTAVASLKFVRLSIKKLRFFKTLVYPTAEFVEPTGYMHLLRTFSQGCGSGSGLDPDSVTLWIRIRFGNPDPGSRGKKVKKFQWKNSLFSILTKILPLKRYKIALTTF